MLLIHRGLRIVENNVDRFADVEAPLTTATYEMEVKVNGIGLAVLNSLATSSPEFRAWVDEDDVDFRNYHSTYERLVGSEREEKVADEIASYFAEFIALGTAGRCALCDRHHRSVPDAVRRHRGPGDVPLIAERHRGTACIVLTAYGSPDSEAAERRHGPSAFLHKPRSMAELLDLVVRPLPAEGACATSAENAACCVTPVFPSRDSALLRIAAQSAVLSAPNAGRAGIEGAADAL